MFDEPVCRPPWEAASMLLPVTQSCTWNKCGFCYRSKDYPFRIAPYEAFAAAIQMQKQIYPEDTAVFFIGSNNFALSADRLKRYLQIVSEEIPRRGRIAMFSRVDAIAAKTDRQLSELNNSGPLHLYVGTENGSDEILALMEKGHTHAEAAEQMKRLERAGITYTVFYILGLGGKNAGQKAAKETAQFFNELHPQQIVTTGMTVTEGTGIASLEQQGGFIQASEREKADELKTFLEELEIDSMYDGTHILNPVHYRFHTGDRAVKGKVIADLERILNGYTEAELEAAVNRQRMATAHTAAPAAQ